MIGDGATIYALASGAGRAGVAVIRISGRQAATCLETLARRPLPSPRTARYGALWCPHSGVLLDRALVLWFPGPASYTGEDVAELHIHGGRACVNVVTEALARIPETRPAEPGEFTRRAFERGKLDLTAAEGVADLVDAETEAQRRQALRQVDGALGQLYSAWRTRLIRALAHGEARIDFSDQDLPDQDDGLMGVETTAIADAVEAHLAEGHRGEKVRSGIEAVILGAPNAGKSTLLNALARRDAAIVSDRAGTTRDVVEVHLDLGGLPVIVCDTAGLAESGDELEQEGIRRARQRAVGADLRIAVCDGRQRPDLDSATAAWVDDKTFLVWTKADLIAGTVGEDGASRGKTGAFGDEAVGARTFVISAHTGQGMAGFLRALEEAARAWFAPGADPGLTRQRHRAALEEVHRALRRAATATLPELVLEDLRLAIRALGRITGQVDVEDVLDVIFRDFCIGK